MHIKWKLASIFLLITVIPMLLLALVTYFNARDVMLKDKIEDVSRVADLKVYEIDTYFKERKADILIAQTYYNIRTNLPVMAQSANDRANPAYLEAKKMLDDQLSTFKDVNGYLNIMLLNAEGKIVYALSDMSAYLDKALPDPGNKAFEEGKKKVYFTDVFRNKYAADRLSIFLTAPEYNAEKNFIGMIALEIDMDFVYKFIRSSSALGKTGETLIVKKVDNNEIEFLTSLRCDGEAVLKRRLRLGSNEAFPAQQAATGKVGSGIAIDYCNKKVIAAWRYLPLLGWGVVAKIDAGEAFASITYFRNFVLLALIIFSFLTIIVSFLLARSISAPITRLSKGVQIIGSGNLDYKMAIDADDEIGQLSRALDGMTSDLKSITASRDELNKEIAERKKAEEVFAISEASYRAIFDSANDAIIIRDIKTYRVIDANNKAYEMFCYSKGEMLDLDLKAMTTDSPRYSLENLEQLYDKASSGEPQVFEWPVKDKFGREFWVETSIKKAIIGGKYCFLAITRDITERRQLMDIKTNFMNMISHELRTPLGAIKEAVSLVSSNKAITSDKDNKELIDIARRNIDRLTRLINQVLDFQKIDSGKIQFKLAETRINDVVKDIHRTMAPVAAKKKLDLTLKLDDNIPPVKLDKDRIIEVLTNLVDNALKFTDKGGVTIATARKDNSILVAIKDTGHGIAQEDMPKLFQRFGQLERKAGGSGLGLAISKELIEMHKGKIWVESEYGKGSVFYFTLPIK